MCAPDPPPAPDYSGIAASSDYAANLGYQAAKDDLDFRRGVYEETSRVSRSCTTSRRTSRTSS